jgi:spore maturation protein CgeB
MARPEMAVPQRILVIGSSRHDSVGDSYRRALEQHYQVTLVSPEPPRRLPRWADKAATLAARALTGEPLAFALPSLERAARAFEPELVLVTHIEGLPPRTIEAIRRASPRARILGVFSDHLANFERGYFFVAPYDALFFKDRYIVDKLRAKLGFRHVWYLPQACDPELHQPVPLEPGDEATYGCDVTLAGNLHYYRAEALRPLLDRPWSVKLWGDEPGRWFHHPVERWFQHRPVIGREKCRAMRAARIVLNQNHYAEIAGTNKRTFEMAAMGAFQLTDTPALADVFEPGVEVASFETQSEMLEQIEHWLARPEERAQMAARASVRAHAEHTYAHRWAAKMAVLGVELPPGFPVRADALAVPAR